MQRTKKIIGLDAGSEKSGVVVIDELGIREGINLPNEKVFDFIKTEVCTGLQVIIEDVRPYNMKITDGLIKTIKYLGEIEYRLRDANISFLLIPRWEVKRWIFNNYTDMAAKEIAADITRFENRSKKKADQEGKEYTPKKRSATFVYVNDRIVQRAMRLHYNLNVRRKFGEKSMYNLKDHSWQALAVCTVAMNLDDYSTVLCIKPSLLMPDSV